MNSIPPRVGMMRHSTGLGGSIGYYFDTLARGLEGDFPLVRLPEYFFQLKSRGVRTLSANLVGESDVVIATNGGKIDYVLAPFAARERLGLDVPILYQPLGEFPRAAAGFFAIYPYLREGDLITFSSSADRAIYHSLIEDMACTDEVLPFGIDPEHFKPVGNADRQAFRNHLEIPEDAVVFIYVGRVTTEKNLQGVLAAFTAARARIPGAFLLVVGDIRDVPFREFGSGPHDLKRIFSAQLSRADWQHVRFFGGMAAEELPRALGAADVFVNLTLHHDENFGYTQVEAMSCGLPVIATAWGGLKDTVAHDETGLHVSTWVTPTGVRIALAEACAAMQRLGTDSALRARMGRNGRARVLKRFTVEHHVSSMRDRIEHAVAARQARHRCPAARSILSPLGREVLETLKSQLERGDQGESLFAIDTPSMNLYQRLISPYAGQVPDMSGAADMSEAVSLPASPLKIDAEGIEIQDPLWPGRYLLDGKSLALMQELRDRRAVRFVDLPLQADTETSNRLTELRTRGFLLPCTDQQAASIS